ncbi:MAG: hypothetical protein ACK5V8_16145, partial [Betaproteobacteria bacterium]
MQPLARQLRHPRIVERGTDLLAKAVAAHGDDHPELGQQAAGLVDLAIAQLDQFFADPVHDEHRLLLD